MVISYQATSVIGKLENVDQCSRLIDHERNRRIVNNGRAYFYESANGNRIICLRGLLPTLKNVYWPTYNGRIVAQNRRSCRDRGRCRLNGRPKAKGIHMGHLRGTRVHKELQDFVEFEPAVFTRRHSSMHPWTKRILNYLFQNGLTPIASEFNVFDPAIGVATSIDMICTRLSGQLVVIEFKTGYQHYFTASTGFMRGPLDHLVRNSARCQAMMQLMVSTIMLARYHRISNIQAWVIRVDADGLDAYKLSSAFVYKYARSVYEHLYNQHKLKVGNKMMK